MRKELKMTTTELIEKLNELADIGIVNARIDSETLQWAAERLYELRAKADPMWNLWLIMDEGLFLSEIGDEESDWTECKDHAVSFSSKEEAQKYLDDHFMEIGGGNVVMRGDVDAGGVVIDFFDLK